MHTNTKRVHRHAVAVPLMLCFLGTVLSSSSAGVASALRVESVVTDQLLEAGETDVPFALENGIAGTVLAGAQLKMGESTLELLHGGVLIASPGIVWLQTDDVSLLGYHGGIVVHKNDDSLTVSAISTPVLLRRRGFVTFIPAGRQGTWSLSALPVDPHYGHSVTQSDQLHAIDEDFARTQLKTINALLEEGAAAPSVANRVLDAGADALDIFRLPSTRDRLALENLERTIDRALELITADDAAALHALLTSSDVERYLRTSPDAVKRLPELLRAASGHPAMLLEILPLLTDPDLQLLAALHPDLRVAAWVGGTATGLDSNELTRLRVLLFPLSDTAPEAAPEIVVNRWGEALTLELTGAADRGNMLEQLFASLNRFVATTSRLGYPDRLDRVLNETKEVLDGFPQTVTDAQREQLSSWTEMLSVPLTEAPEESVEAQPMPSAAPVDGPTLEDVLREFGTPAPSAATTITAPLTSEAKAAISASSKQILLTAGALFTVETRLEVIAEHAVTVSGVVFSGTDGDHFYSFTFDPVSLQLTSISKDGDAMPFGMTLTKFTEWVKGE